MINSNISIILYVACVVIFFIKFFSLSFRSIKLSVPSTIIISLFFLYMILPIGPYNFSKFVKISLFIILFILLLAFSCDGHTFRLEKCANYLALGIITSSIISMLYFIPGLNISHCPIMYTSSGDRFCALTPNPNIFAMICEISLAFTGYNILSHKRCMVYVIAFILVGLCGAFTLSKAFLVILILLLVVIFIGRMIIAPRSALLTLLVFLLICGIILIAKPGIITVYVSRFVSNISGAHDAASVMDVIFTGRFSLWMETAKYLLNNPLQLFFGAGLGAGYIPQVPSSPHNAYLSSLYQIGLVGSILLLLSLIFIFRGKSRQAMLPIICIILVICSMLFVEDMIFFINPTLAIM